MKTRIRFTSLSRSLVGYLKMPAATLSLLTILYLALSAPAFAGSEPILYTNGPTNGASNAYFIDVNAVSDSFVSAVNASLSGVTIAEWVPAGATPLTVDWAIGTMPSGSDLGSGHMILANDDEGPPTLLCSNGHGNCGGGFGYDVYLSHIDVGEDAGGSPIHVLAGQTYWLTLTNATDNFGGRDAWDINSGPSLAYHSLLGEVPSESFTVEGEGAGGTTPEPSSLALFGSGILSLGALLRKRLHG